MLVEKVYTGDRRYKYVCDKCGKPINTSADRRYKIGIDTPKERTSGMKIVKRYDLCKKCTSIIVNYIEKGK